LPGEVIALPGRSPWAQRPLARTPRLRRTTSAECPGACPSRGC